MQLKHYTYEAHLVKTKEGTKNVDKYRKHIKQGEYCNHICKSL